MNKKILSIGLIFLVLFFVQLCSAQDSDPDQTGTNVKLLELDGAIGPIAVQIIEKGIDQAEKANSEALIILLNTPGGLTESTWKITKAIMNSYVPVVVYIYPQGAPGRFGGSFYYLQCAYSGHGSGYQYRGGLGSFHGGRDGLHHV